MMGAFLESRLAMCIDFLRKELPYRQTDEKIKARGRSFSRSFFRRRIRRAYTRVARHVGGMLSPTPCFLFPSATFSGPPGPPVPLSLIHI